jgi:FAD/FMN-containing dehydrogenase
MADATTRLAPRHLDQLRRSAGEVITPDHTSYDDARRLWNAIHDRRPAVIVRPTNPRQIAAAVQFAREHDLEITVRSGGHSAAGFGGANGGLLVDMSAMRGVEADPRTRTARANGGALLGELDIAAQAHGLVCPVGVVGHTGVAGLTLGGGVGRLQRNFGLTIDNLAAVELVTADGRLVRASATEEPELFWGLRGAGWNFGIATAFEFRLHPFGPDLHRGVTTFPATQIQDVWTVFRDYAAVAPDTVSIIFGIDRAGPDAGYPDDMIGKPITYLAWNDSGSADAVERDTAGLRAGPKPTTTTTGSAPYLDVQTAHDLAFAWGNRSFIKSHNANDVRREALDELVELVATAPGWGTFSVTALGGAIGRVAEEATAYAGRDAAYDLSVDSSWSDASLDEANMDWSRRVMAVVEPDRTLGAYANGNSDASPEESRRIYGEAKLARLTALKRAWDPDNVFHVNPNVAPARTGPRD